MKQKITQKESRFLSITIACCGLLLIGSGLIMSTSKEKTIIKKNFTLDISEQKVAESKTNEIKLKDMELEINNPLSLNVKDYIENVEEIENSVLKALKLDTSLVNINQAGTYNYTITYKKKKYNGNFVIKEKELPQVELTLKNISLEKGAALSTNVSTYIVEEISDEVKNNIILNIKNVNTAQPGEYQYSLTYDGKLYTGKIWIYEKQTTVITPNTPAETETPRPSESPNQPGNETPTEDQESNG